MRNGTLMAMLSATLLKAKKQPDYICDAPAALLLQIKN